MFSFFKKKKSASNLQSAPQKPIWSPFETNQQHAIFIHLIGLYFSKKNIAHSIGDGIVNTPDKSLQLGQLGLQNIAQHCANSEEEQYANHIANHFDMIIRGQQWSREFDKIKKDFDQVKQYLSIRIQSNEYISSIGLDKLLGKQLVGNLYAMLIYDLPETIQSINPKDVDAWDKDFDTIWDISIYNTLGKYPPNILDRELQGIKVKTIEEDHFFSPTIIFNLEDHPSLLGTHGSLITMPTRHIVIIYPIEDASVIQAITTLITVSEGVSARGPGTLSNQLFWYHKGDLDHQPYKVEETTISFQPSERFVAFLQTLAPDQEN